MKDKKIAVIGHGNLGSAIAKGIVQTSLVGKGNLLATKRNIEKDTSYPYPVIPDNTHAIKSSDIVILALKPYNILPFLNLHKDYFNPQQVIISVATGIEIKQMKDILGDNFEIYRAMPNTASKVNQAVTCIATGENKTHLSYVKQIFNTLGETIIIDEPLMEAATILGACGIAYVLRFMRAMTQGGIQIGFDATTAQKIVNQTVLGAASLLTEQNNHPEEEIDKVTTPKGCTIVGLNEMEHNGFSSSLIKGIVSSYKAIAKD
ncbi:MAG: pyrroline-5-carboxylate reductase [Bacteroidetes bacterium]|nr:MAG: pyrroline-5-carboxylate reductase [Bacteroidota bacterium]